MTWNSKVGLWIPGKEVKLYNEDLFTIHKKVDTWYEYLMFSITGERNRFTKNQLVCLEKMWTYIMTYPDHKIWINRVASLAGTAGTSPQIAISSANTCGSGRIFSTNVTSKVGKFLVDVDSQLKDKSLVNVLIENGYKTKTPVSFDRPLSALDERINSTIILLKETDNFNNKYITLLFEINHILMNVFKRNDIKMTIGALVGAIFLDFKIKPLEAELLTPIMLIGGVIPCFTDTFTEKKGSFLPMGIDSIEYIGPAPRKWNK